jgi:hypothetical protein
MFDTAYTHTQNKKEYMSVEVYEATGISGTMRLPATSSSEHSHRHQRFSRVAEMRKGRRKHTQPHCLTPLNKVMVFPSENRKGSTQHADDFYETAFGSGRGTYTVKQTDSGCSEHAVSSIQHGGSYALFRYEVRLLIDFVIRMHDDDASLIGIVPLANGEPFTIACRQKGTVIDWEHAGYLVGGCVLFRHRLPGGSNTHSTLRFFRTSLMDFSFEPDATDGNSQHNGDTRGAIANATPRRRAKRKPEDGDKCRRVRAMMRDYVLRQLSKDERSMVTRHVRKCDGCHAAMIALQATVFVDATIARET